jgi:hypothetical protein
MLPSLKQESDIFLTAALSLLIILPFLVITLRICRRLGFALDRTSYDDITPPNKVRCVVTLVHGTWPRGFLNLGREVEWYCSNSVFCAALSSVNKDATLIHRFAWSGANTIAARLDGAKKLRSELRLLLDKHPDARHFLVAHSHGGNIALSAIDESSIAARISGIVALSTPFVRISLKEWVREELDFGRGMLQQLVPGFTGLFLVFAALYCFWHADDSLSSLSTHLPRPIVVLFLAIELILFLAMVIGGVGWSMAAIMPFFAQRSWRKLRQKAVDYVAAVCVSRLDQVRLLIVRPVEDEASATLMVGQFVSWVFGSFEDRCVILLFPVFVTAVLVKVITTIAKFLHHQLSHDYGDLALTALVYIIAILVTLQIVRGLLTLPFGARLAQFAPLLDISAEAAPPGVWTILQLPPSKKSGLFHSSTHEAPEAASAVARWISNSAPASK